MPEKLKQAFLYVKDFCEDTADNIKETVITAMDAAKLHYRIVSQRNSLNSLYAMIGKSELHGTAGSDEELSYIRERITKKEELLVMLEKQYRIVCGKVICPDCGRFMSDSFAFCPFCGRRMSDVEIPFESDVSEDELSDLREME